MSAEKIISSWKKKQFRPLYLLEGEEEYYIDQVMHYAEHHLLSESEASFNLTVFYGKDANWADVINACRRYPMFSERQVVLLKEAQQMTSLEQLQAYIENPLDSTIFIIGYKGKTLDKRTRLYKSITKSGEILTSSKLRDDRVPEWISELVKAKGLNIQPKAVSLLHEHIGNDLARISGEIDKLSLNITKDKVIDDADIERYVGISKEYNIFELGEAIARRDLPKALKILQYFEGNPKAAPIQMALPALYANFSKVYSAFGLPSQSDDAMMTMFYKNPVAVRQAREMMRNYGFRGMEKIILLMHDYNLRSLGVGSANRSDSELMKELIIKIMMSEN